jgi:butyryl-CoA dehydrogenase/short/branched chain acyl-CoA dehydrogenase
LNLHSERRPITQLGEDEILFRDAVREFAQGEVTPLVRRMDEEQQMDAALVGKLFALGLMGIEIPEEFGGSAGSFFDSVLAVEILSAVDPAVGLVVDVHNTLVASALLRWGTAEQKKRYLPRLATDTVGAYALSEAGSGSDAFALQTRAERRGEAYRLSGRKLWISNAKEAGLFIVFATVDASAGYKGITAFLVEKNTPGFSVGRKEDKLGIRASSTCELILDECEVAETQVLGEAGSGYKIAMETLNGGRIGIGAQMLGLAEGAWAHAMKHAKQRKQFGKTLAEFQAMQFQLAEMATDVEAARLMVYNAARLKDAGLEFRKEAAMCKYFASHTAERVASLAVEVLGGAGFVKESPVEKLYRDAKIGKIYEGTSFMQLAAIAKMTL